MFGYLLTETGQDALDCFGQEGVRFAASLSDGSGIVAFDDVLPRLAGANRILMAQEPIPDDPRTWPDWASDRGKIAPKRARATGREHFALISDALLEYAMQTTAVTGLVGVGDGMLLIESDGPVVGGDVWSASVVSWRDVREMASA